MSVRLTELELCPPCGQPILDGQQAVGALGVDYHEPCFDQIEADAFEHGHLPWDSGCDTCGTCCAHNGCEDTQNPHNAERGDCAECGACGGCVRACADANQT